MNPQPDFERLRTAVSHKEADRVPLVEPHIGYGIMSRFLGREVASDDIAARVEFFQKAGYDYVPVVVSLMVPGKVTEESHITRLLKEMVLAKNPGETDPKAWNLEMSSFIHEEADFERFPWQEAEHLDTSLLDKALPLLPSGMKAVVLSGKIFTLTWMLMGFNDFSMKLILEPELVEKVINKVGQIQVKALETLLDKEQVGAVWLVDDLASGNGPLISPDHLRRYVFPWYKKVARMCHDRGRLVFLHSDGVMNPILPDLIDIGIDMFHPVDPTCMDIFKTKKDFGDKIAFCGNVPNELLRIGTPDEVADYTKRLLKECAPGGGYCVASGNSVPDWADFENYQTMRETALELGGYPISL